MMAGNYIRDFAGFSHVFGGSNRAVRKLRRQDMEEIPEHRLAGTIQPGKCIQQIPGGHD